VFKCRSGHSISRGGAGVISGQLLDMLAFSRVLSVSDSGCLHFGLSLRWITLLLARRS
jgi:hypothetical protein